MTEKFNGFFEPGSVKHPIHIVGCGAIGSTLAIMLTRCGLSNITLWDFDTVATHNLANQQFTYPQIGRPKTEALSELMQQINPQIKIKTKGKWISGDLLDGHVFLAVDNIELRKQIVTEQRGNNNVQSMWDFRMRLKDAQHYGYGWSDLADRERLLSTMQFTQEEADVSTPVNACNMTMSIMPTVQAIVSVGVGNFINFIHGKKPERLIMVNPFDMMLG